MPLSQFDEQTTSAFTAAKLKCFGTLGSLIKPCPETRSMRVLHKIAFRNCAGAPHLDEIKFEKQNLERTRRQQRGTVRAPELRLMIIELAKSIVTLEKDITFYKEAADKAKLSGDIYGYQNTLDRLKYRLPLEKKKLRRFRTELGKLNLPTATHQPPVSCDAVELQEARTRDHAIQKESRDQWKRDRRMKPNWDNTKRNRKLQVRRHSRLSTELSRDYVEPLYRDEMDSSAYYEHNEYNLNYYDYPIYVSYASNRHETEFERGIWHDEDGVYDFCQREQARLEKKYSRHDSKSTPDDDRDVELAAE